MVSVYPKEATPDKDKCTVVQDRNQVFLIYEKPNGDINLVKRENGELKSHFLIIEPKFQVEVGAVILGIGKGK